MTRPALPRRALWAAAAVAAVVVLAAIAWKVVRLADAAERARADVEATLTLLADLPGHLDDPRRVRAAGHALATSAHSLEALRAELAGIEPLLRLARYLPPRVSWLADVPEALALGISLAEAGSLVAPPLAEALELTDAEQPLLSRYLAATPRLVALEPQLNVLLDRMEPSLHALHGRTLGGPLRPFTSVVHQVAEAFPAARQALALLEPVASALGIDRPRTYLLVGQNSHEIRATGGFIGSAGVLAVYRGRPQELRYGSAYELDAHVRPPDPPAPLARHLGLGGWYLRDANWWPDFPASAAELEAAWQRATGRSLDGVIAFDNTAVQALLRFLGPVEVPAIGSVDADQVDRIIAERLYSAETLASAEAFHRARSAVLGALGRRLVERLLATPAERYGRLAREIGRLLSEKHLLLAIKDQRLLEFLDRQGWDGALKRVEGDVLYIVDTTVSYGDTYPFIRSRADLEVDVQHPDRQVHQLVLEYANEYPRGVLAWMPQPMVSGARFDPVSSSLVETPGFWGNWLRIYLPASAIDIGVAGLEEAAAPRQQFDHLLVEGYVPVMPGRTRRVQLRYTTLSDRLPAAAQSYRLLVRKQPGLDCRPVTVTVRWSPAATAREQLCPRTDQWVAFDAPAPENPEIISDGGMSPCAWSNR